MQIIAVAIQRGGTGKTTTTATLAQAAAYEGKKVLAIDLDAQGNLTLALGANTAGKNAFDVLNGTPARQAIQQTAAGIDVIPASWNLSTETTSAGSANRLRDALAPIKRLYDLILIDCPPAAGELQYNALQAATRLIIPLEADYFCLQGLYQIADAAAQFKGIKDKGIVITNYDPRSTLTRQMREKISGQAEALGLNTLGVIRAGVAIKEAQALQQSIYRYARNSKPAADYLEVYHKIMGV